MDEPYLNVLDDAFTPGGASEEAISKAEQTLGISFPTSYREFLKKYGAAMGAGYEIAGIFTPNEDEPPMWRDVVAFSNQMRRMAGTFLLETLIPISSDGVSVTYFLDVSNQETSPVIALATGNDEVQVAQSFEEFVVKLSNGDLDVLA